MSAQVMLGNRYLMEGRYTDALGAFESALKQACDLGVVYYRLGVTYLYLRHPAEAIAVLERARRMAPHWDEVVCKLALAYVQTGEPGKASQLLESNPEWRQRRADQPVSFGYLHAATLDTFLQRVAQADASVTDWACLAILYYLQGALSKALEAYKQSLKLDPAQTTLSALLGRAEPRVV